MAYRPLKNAPVVWCDIETTGLDPVTAEIIEFAGIRFEDGKEVNRLELKIKPRFIKDPPMEFKDVYRNFDAKVWAKNVQHALKINGYTPEAWEAAGAVTYDEGIPIIAKFLKGATAVGGHNVSFDAAFIDYAVTDLAPVLDDDGKIISLPYHKIDTVALAYEHLVPLGLNKVSLSKPGGLCTFLNIPTDNAHTAMADIEMTIQAWNQMKRAGWMKRLWWRFIGPRRVARAKFA